MKLEDIRKLNDKELTSFINNLKTSTICDKCGNILMRESKKTINVSIYNQHIGQLSRKLCSLCNDCYIDLLDYLGISDIEWDE